MNFMDRCKCKMYNMNVSFVLIPTEVIKTVIKKKSCTYTQPVSCKLTICQSANNIYFR